MQPLGSTPRATVPRRTVILLSLFSVGLTVVLMSACSKHETSPDATTAAAPLEISRTNLVLMDGRLKQPAFTNAFTGFMVEHYAGGILRSRSAVSNGLLHGLSQGWYTNGQMQVSEYFRDGVSQMVRTKWYADGGKQSEAGIVDGKLHGTFQKWHTNGVMSEWVEFSADQPVGTSTSWFPSGYLKGRVTLRDGKPVEQQFWKDGERAE